MRWLDRRFLREEKESMEDRRVVEGKKGVVSMRWTVRIVTRDEGARWGWRGGKGGGKDRREVKRRGKVDLNDWSRPLSKWTDRVRHFRLDVGDTMSLLLHRDTLRTIEADFLAMPKIRSWKRSKEGKERYEGRDVSLVWEESRMLRGNKGTSLCEGRRGERLWKRGGRILGWKLEQRSDLGRRGLSEGGGSRVALKPIQRKFSIFAIRVEWFPQRTSALSHIHRIRRSISPSIIPVLINEIKVASSGTLIIEKNNPAFEVPPLPISVNPTNVAIPAIRHSIVRSLWLPVVDENFPAIGG